MRTGAGLPGLRGQWRGAMDSRPPLSGPFAPSLGADSQPCRMTLDADVVCAEILGILRTSVNADGGWGDFARKASRLEPTCWAILALRGAGYGAGDEARVDAALTLVASWQKPNLVEYESGTMINTHPVVIAGAIEAFRRAGAREVVVGEGPGHRRDTEYLLAASGLSDYLRELRVPFIDLNVDDVRPVTLRSRFTGRDTLLLPVEVLKSDVVVSMAKLKTHHWAGMTAAMKNLFGLVPGAVYGWPKNLLHYGGIDASILDLNATIRPAFRHRGRHRGDGGRWPDHGVTQAMRVRGDGRRPGGCRCDVRPDHGPRAHENRLPS